LLLPLFCCYRLHPFLQQYLDPNFHPSLIEVILYKGREVELRFSDGNSTFLDSRSNVHQALELLAVAKERWQLQDEQEFASDDDGAQHRAIGSSLNHSSSSFRSIHSSLSNAADKPSRSCSMRAYGDMFHSDQRLGVPSTLHRIAAIRNRDNDVIGLTYRIGRHVPGVALMLGDLLSAMKASLESHRYAVATPCCNAYADRVLTAAHVKCPLCATKGVVVVCRASLFLFFPVRHIVIGTPLSYGIDAPHSLKLACSCTLEAACKLHASAIASCYVICPVERQHLKYRN